MKTLKPLLLTFSLLFAFTTNAMEDALENHEDISNGINQFAFLFSNDLLTKHENYTFSPLSINLALSMVFLGAKGESKVEFGKIFGNSDNFHQHFGQLVNNINDKDRAPTKTSFKISNNIWLQNGITLLKDYQNVLATSYGAEKVRHLDFKHDAQTSTAQINKSISTDTNDEIPKLLKETVSNQTRLILTNALYFNAFWQKQFIEDSTYDGDFHKAEGQAISARYMCQGGKYSYGEDSTSQYLLMPYKDQDFATLFVLPREGESISNFTMDVEKFNNILKTMSSKNMSIRLPKFNQRTSPNVKEFLVDLGLGSIFDEKSADFSGITGSKDLFVGDIVHEAVVKIYEAGTTAAAATAVLMMGPTSIRPIEQEVIDFHVTRPFFYYILHKPTNMILFMGRIMHPLDQDND